MTWPLHILDEGPHHAVLDKPAGVVVVRARGVPGPTVLDVAQERYGAGVRPVHRLDRGTTGCLVVARTPFGQQALSDAFRRHLIDKRYLAIVQGLPSFERLDIDARLARVDEPAARRGPVARQTLDPAGQRALTRVRVWARGEAASLIEARPETGRMHQIRIHCAHVGHPLIGDALYGASEVAERPLLHAAALSFPAPSGGRRFALCPPPADFVAAAARVGIDALAVFQQIAASFAPAPARPASDAAARSPAPSARGAAGHGAAGHGAGAATGASRGAGTSRGGAGGGARGGARSGAVGKGPAPRRAPPSGRRR